MKPGDFEKLKNKIIGIISALENKIPGDIIPHFRNLNQFLQEFKNTLGKELDEKLNEIHETNNDFLERLNNLYINYKARFSLDNQSLLEKIHNFLNSKKKLKEKRKINEIFSGENALPLRSYIRNKIITPEKSYPTQSFTFFLITDTNENETLQRAAIMCGNEKKYVGYSVDEKNAVQLSTLGSHKNLKNSKILEITIDETVPLNLTEMERKMDEITHRPLIKHNIISVREHFKEIISAGCSSWSAPRNLSPENIFSSLIKLASKAEKEKFFPLFKNSAEQALTLFSKKLIFMFENNKKIFNEMIQFYKSIESFEVVIPSDYNKWFAFLKNNNPYSSFDMFVKHIITLSIGIIRKKDIALEHIYQLVKGVYVGISYYQGNMDCEADSFMDACNPLTNILKLPNGFLNEVDFNNLREKTRENFKKLITPDFFAEGAYNLSKKEQVEAFFLFNGFKATVENEIENKIRDRMFDYKFMLKTPNFEYHSHLNKFLGLMMQGLDEDKPSFKSMLYTRRTLWKSYYLENESKNLISPIPKDFYEDNRNILRQHLSLTAQTIYFNEYSLYVASTNIMNIEIGWADINAPIEKLITFAVNEYKNSISRNYINEPIPPAWKFWKCSDRNKMLYHNALYKVTEALSKKLDPLTKTNKINEILSENKREFYFFKHLNKKEHRDYQSHIKRAEIILFYENFLGGFCTEEEFIYNLRDHSKRYSCKHTLHAAKLFEQKYMDHVNDLLFSSGDSSVKKIDKNSILLLFSKELEHFNHIKDDKNKLKSAAGKALSTIKDYCSSNNDDKLAKNSKEKGANGLMSLKKQAYVPSPCRTGLLLR